MVTGYVQIARWCSSQPRRWRNLWDLSQQRLPLDACDAKGACQGPIAFLFWTAWTVEITDLGYLNYKSTNWICIAKVSSCFGSKDNFRTFQVQNLRSFSTTIPPKPLKLKKLPKHGGGTISKPKYFSIYWCKTSYKSQKKNKSTKNIEIYIYVYI